MLHDVLPKQAAGGRRHPNGGPKPLGFRVLFFPPASLTRSHCRETTHQDDCRGHVRKFRVWGFVGLIHSFDPEGLQKSFPPNHKKQHLKFRLAPF